MSKTGKYRRTNSLLFLALFMGLGVFQWAKASPGVSAFICSRESLVDALNSRGMPSDTVSRRKMAEADPHTEMRKMLPYTKTAQQNKHLLADLCGGGVSRVARHPKVSEAEQREIIASLRDTARAHGVDEVKFVGTARCESEFYSRALGDFGHSRGIFQFHNQYRSEVSDDIAFNWRRAAHIAVKDFATERTIWSRTQHRRVFRSEAFQWSCYRKLYGLTSARANQTFAVNSE